MVEEKREVLACPVECEKSVVMVCASKRILPKVPVTEDFLVHISISKFDDRQPLYRMKISLLQGMALTSHVKIYHDGWLMRHNHSYHF